MAPEQDDFQQLRRLLALKRHEQPPPGYFDNFSREIILRLRAGEATPKFSLLEIFSADAPWLQRLLSLVQNRPALAGGFGFAACSLLVAGLLLSEPNNAQELSAGAFATATPVAQQFPAAAITTPILYGGSASAQLVNDVVVPPSQLTGSLFQQLKQLPRHPQLLGSPAPGSMLPN